MHMLCFLLSTLYNVYVAAARVYPQLGAICPDGLESGDLKQDLVVRGEPALRIQWKLLAFSFRCTFLRTICLLQVSRLPCTWGICVLFNDSGGHVCLLAINVMCLHFCSFFLIRQSDSHLSITRR